MMRRLRPVFCMVIVFLLLPSAPHADTAAAAEPPVAPPPSPTNVRTTEVTTAAICIRWDWDAPDALDGFRVYNTTTGAVRRTAPPTGRSNCTDTPRPNTTLCYAIAAFNSAGESARTEPLCVRAPTPVSAPQIPDVPSNLRVTLFSTERICFAWTPVGYVDGYHVYSAEGALVFNEGPSDTPGICSLNPKADTQRCYTVSAFNSLGASAKSGTLCVTAGKPAATTYTPPSQLPAAAPAPPTGGAQPDSPDAHREELTGSGDT